MRLVDDKGRLFGKINVIDLFVIVVILSFASVLYFGYKITAKAPHREAKIAENVPVEVQVTFIDVIPELASIMKVGDDDADSSGKTSYRLLKIFEVAPYQMNITAGDKIVAADNPARKQVRAKIELSCNRESDGLYYKGQLIKIGRPLNVSSKTYVASAIITGLKEE